MRLFPIMIILILLLDCGCIIPTREHICPDGSIVFDWYLCSEYMPEKLGVDPDDFHSITLGESKNYYVQSNGQVNANVQIFGNEEIRLIVGPNVIYTGLEQENEGKMPRLVNGNTYQVNITAPYIPGEYSAFVKSYDGKAYLEYREFNITVIAEVPNETMAEEIAENFMKTHSKIHLGSSDFFEGWKIIGREINSQGDNWDVFLEVKYSVCNTFIDLPPQPRTQHCSGTFFVTGHYLIDKKTGQIVG